MASLSSLVSECNFISAPVIETLRSRDTNTNNNTTILSYNPLNNIMIHNTTILPSDRCVFTWKLKFFTFMSLIDLRSSSSSLLLLLSLSSVPEHSRICGITFVFTSSLIKSGVYVYCYVCMYDALA